MILIDHALMVLISSILTDEMGTGENNYSPSYDGAQHGSKETVRNGYSMVAIQIEVKLIEPRCRVFGPHGRY